MKTNNKFEQSRTHLIKLSDEELYSYFWELAEKIVDPLIKLARNYTSPSIERSILLRMGFSSQESQILVKKCIDNDLMRKGAGNVVYSYSKYKHMNIRQAGLQLIEIDNWTEVKQLFK